MKKIYIVIAGLMLTASVFAQAPEKMSYQAVIRNASNNLTTNQAVGMQISILQGSAGGNSVYTETQSPTTNTNGLVSLEIGTGTTADDFSTIDWTSGPYFIKTETDPTTAGGTNYTITGTTQLMSVPYALHAKTAESITGSVNYTETDPVYTAWDKSTGISITESQISDLTHTVDTDTQLDSTGIAALGFNAGNNYYSTERIYELFNTTNGTSGSQKGQSFTVGPRGGYVTSILSNAIGGVTGAQLINGVAASKMYIRQYVNDDEVSATHALTGTILDISIGTPLILNYNYGSSYPTVEYRFSGNLRLLGNTKYVIEFVNGSGVTVYCKIVGSYADGQAYDINGINLGLVRDFPFALYMKYD